MALYIADVWFGGPSPDGFGVSDVLGEADNAFDAARQALTAAEEILGQIKLSDKKFVVNVRKM